jgi:hypothetical protein
MQRKIYERLSAQVNDSGNRQLGHKNRSSGSAAHRDGTSRAVVGFGPNLIRACWVSPAECCQSFAFCGHATDRDKLSQAPWL